MNLKKLYEEAQSEPRSGGGSTFLKLESGSSVQGVLRGDATKFGIHWVGNRSVSCPGADDCEHCQNGERPKVRYLQNFVIYENGAYVAKLFEFGWTVLEQMANLAEDYDLSKWIIKISKTGQKLDTTYKVVPKPNGALTKDQEAAISAVQLHDPTPKEKAALKAVKNDDIPF